MRRLKIVVSLIVASVVIHDSWGTYIYQFYRADTPDSPRSLILASDNLRWLHTILMEYKEFVAGFVPILTIAALFAIFYYGDDLLPRHGVRIAILIILARVRICFDGLRHGRPDHQIRSAGRRRSAIGGALRR